MLASLELLRQLEDGEIVPPVKKKKVYSVCEIMKGHNKDLKERVRHIQALHDYWNERISYKRSNMHWRTVDGNTTYHEDLLPEQRAELLKDKYEYFPGFKTRRRCVLDCVTYYDCKCHPWYGIVLTEDGTEVNTELSPIPEEPYTRCADCYHKASAEYRYTFYTNISEEKRMCKRCIEVKKPLRCMVLTGGYDFPGC
jgi:hypothetical protein